MSRFLIRNQTLKHPNIVRLYDVIETDKYIGIILEYASGGELFDHILAHRYLRERDAAKLFSQLISGVWYIHQKKIVHRDLKLENLLLDRHRNVIITDFGFANRFEHRADDLMQTSCGSPCYAAPELVISEGLYVGSAVDIWSCGVILYAMLAGYLPFDDDPANPDGDNINLLYKYIVNTPLSFPDYISTDARDLLSIMLVPDPSRRSSLEEVMRHPWLAAYPTSRDVPSPTLSGVPTAFGRTVEQLERQALDQHHQRRMAYQRQMRAAAQAAHQQAAAVTVGRTQSHHVSTSGSGHRQANEIAVSPSRSQSTQPEFFYDSSVDVSTLTNVPASSPVSASASRRPILEVGDDPFGPPPHSTRTALHVAEASQLPKGHKANGSGSGAGGFRHTIQVEYEAEPRSHGSQSARRSEDREGRSSQETQQQEQPQQVQRQSPQRPRANGHGVPSALSPVTKERQPSTSVTTSSSKSKPLPSPPPTVTTIDDSSSSFSPVSPGVSSIPSTSSRIPTPIRTHKRTPSTPVVPTSGSVPPVTPNIYVDGASPPASPVKPITPVSHVSGAERASSHERRVSVDKKVNGISSSSSGKSTAAITPSRVPSDSGRSEKSMLSSVSTEKSQKEKTKDEGKKSRRNTLTVMVEPFRRKGTKTRVQSSGEELPSSVATTPNSTVNGKEKAEKLVPKHLVPPHSAGVNGSKRDASFSGADAEMGFETGTGLQASTNKARKVMAWFRGRSRGRDEDEEPKSTDRSTTPTQAEYNQNVNTGATKPAEKRKDNVLPVAAHPPTSNTNTPRVPSASSQPDKPQRTPSTATADTSVTTGINNTPSFVSRFRNSVTIGGRGDRGRDRTVSQSQHQQQQQSQHPWGMLRPHHGAVDQSMITTKSPPDVIRHVRAVLESMGVMVQVESEYKYRCVRARRRKGSMVMGGVSMPPASGGLAAVKMVGSAASNGVRSFVRVS